LWQFYVVSNLYGSGYSVVRIAPRLRMGGATHLVPLYAFMLWKRKVCLYLIYN
jgi:hypothetical protein